MECNLSVNSLEARNVNESAPVPLIVDQQDGFILQEPNVFLSCLQNTQDPFATFCLIPKDPVNDPMGSNMCSLALTQTEQPNSLFERMIRGDIQYINQMEVIWESAKINLPNPSVPWFDVMQLEHIVVDSKTQDYLGFATVDDLDAMSVSNNGGLLIGVRNGMLYESQPDGFVRENSLVQGENDPVQTTVTSPNAFVCAALFSNQLFFFVNQNWFLFQFNSNNNKNNNPNNLDPIFYYQNIKLWKSSSNANVIYISVLGLSSNQNQWVLYIFQFTDNNRNTSNLADIQPVVIFGQSVPEGQIFRLGAITVSSNDQTLIVCTFLSTSTPDTMNIHSIAAQNITQKTVAQYNRWSCVSIRFQILLTPVQDYPIVDYSAALCDQQDPENNSFFLLMTLRVLSFNFSLPLSGGPVTDLVFLFSEVPLRGMRLNESVDHVQRLYVYNSQLRTTLSHFPPLTTSNQPFSLIDITSEKPFSFALAYTQNASNQPKVYDAWIFRNHGTLYRLHFSQEEQGEENLLQWTSNFNLYSSRLAKISDFGLPGVLDPTIYVPGATWYLGTLTQSTSIPLITKFPTEIVRSKHQTFRYLATGVKTQEPTAEEKVVLRTFPFIVNQLQRANEYGLARSTASGGITLANTSNVIMNNVWESNTTDQVNDPDSVNTLNLNTPPFAVSSPNGLYLLYVTPNMKMRLVFNNFNNARFNEWNRDNIEKLGNSIDIQSNFCWNSLKIPDEKVAKGASLFTDFRCMCIGGKRLFALTVPNAENIPEGVVGPLEQNMPCVTTACNLGINNAIQDTETNVETYTKSRCSNRIFSICQNNVAFGPGTSLVNVNIITPQLCGINQVVCDEKNSCGPDQVCENGRCVPKCSSDQECAQMFGNTFNLRCISSKCQLVEQPPSSTNIPILIAIICAIITLFIILLFVGLIAKRKKIESQIN